MPKILKITFLLNEAPHEQSETTFVGKVCCAEADGPVAALKFQIVKKLILTFGLPIYGCRPIEISTTLGKWRSARFLGIGNSASSSAISLKQNSPQRPQLGLSNGTSLACVRYL